MREDWNAVCLRYEVMKAAAGIKTEVAIEDDSSFFAEIERAGLYANNY